MRVHTITDTTPDAPETHRISPAVTGEVLFVYTDINDSHAFSDDQTRMNNIVLRILKIKI